VRTMCHGGWQGLILKSDAVAQGAKLSDGQGIVDDLVVTQGQS
jgi:hypothetical protein